MSDLTVNGLPVLSGDLLLPRVGAWSAVLALDAETAPTGSVTTESPAGFRAVGFVERGSTTAGRVEVRVRAGAGQLGRELAPVAYRPVGGVRVRTVLEDWARESGERLSTRVAAEITETFLPAWTRERGSAARAIRSLALALGCSWRFDGDGGLLLVRETWPTVDPDGVQLLREDPISDAVELAVDVPLPEFVPGVTWQGRRVSAVEAFIVGNGMHRVRLLFENGDTTEARDRVALKYNVTPREEIDAGVYARTYLARVVAQSADLSTVDVELEPDVAPEKRSMPGLVRVPLYAGIPGQVIELRLDGALQQFCIVTFLNGDRAKPIVSGWLGSPNNNAAKRAQTTRIRARFIELGEGAARKVARDTDPVGPNAAMTAWMTDVSTRVSALTSTSGPVANPSSLPTITPPSSLGTITDGSPALKTD